MYPPSLRITRFLRYYAWYPTACCPFDFLLFIVVRHTCMITRDNRLSPVYFPLLILSISSFWFSLRYLPISSTVIPSIPGAPLFAFTLLKALLRFPLSSISSKSSGCALSLSFHIRRKERCALTYPSRSALSLCEQLSLFSVPKVLSSFPGCI